MFSCGCLLDVFRCLLDGGCIVGYKCVSTVVVFEDFIDKGLVISSHFRDGGSAHWATTCSVGYIGELFNTFIAEFVVAIEGDRLLFFIGAITNCAFLWFCCR